MNLTQFMKLHPLPMKPATQGDVIPEGQRNSTLSRFALCVLKKYGVDNGKAQQAFAEESAKCSPPLDARELQTNSAMKCYREKVQTNPTYIPPAEYAAQDFAENLIPDHLTDVGQSKKLAELYHGQLRYSDATLWLSYDGRRWQENSAAARGYVHDLTDRQMKQAHRLVTTAQDAMLTAQEQQDNSAAESAKSDLNFAQTFHKFAREYQKSSRISATLTEATPYLQIDVEQLDADAFLLNTPAGTVDLRDGSIRTHDPEDFCTKITGCALGGEGMELFREFLDRITCGDRELQDYLQMIAGMFAVGAVYRECLIIAYGGGGNGKSTLFNLLAMVMGDYAGNLSAETLTANCRKNKSPEYAEMRGYADRGMQKKCETGTGRSKRKETPDCCRVGRRNAVRYGDHQKAVQHRQSTGGEEIQSAVFLHAVAHAGFVHEPFAQGRNYRQGHMGQADRRALHGEPARTAG